MNFQMWCCLLAGVGCLNLALITTIEEDTPIESPNYTTQEECNKAREKLKIENQPNCTNVFILSGGQQ